MLFEGSRRSSHVPNLTPLLDIIFLLLIFFMLTSHFVRDDALSLQLPETESGVALDERKSIEVVIDAQGKWLYAERPVDAITLLSVLEQDLAKRTDKRVRIRGDKTSDLGRMVTVLDIARKAGATGVDVVTENR